MRYARSTQLALLTLSLASSALEAQATPDSTRPRRGVGDRRELEAFVDGVIGSDMANNHVAGAMVAVVRNDSIILLKGYGWADVDRGIPVDPVRTLFRPGSVSKLFTWTAVMQQVEQGRLDLDRDVNEYLDFKIPATYPEPITLRHLLNHSAGFQEDARGLISADSSSLTPMSVWIPEHLPARVRPPGTFASYSNTGTAIAGYIVERVSGVPFEDYIQRNILDPLGMRHSTAHQPIPAGLAGDMSVGYEWTGGRFKAHGFEFLPGAAPAGMMSASAGDLARFMIAHLRHGELDGNRILADSTSRLMQRHAFGHHPGLPGFALGFYEKDRNGLRIIGHGGDSQWFHTELSIVPEENLGVYVSFNTDVSGRLTGPFLETFFDHFYPGQEPEAVVGDFPARAERFAGVYQNNRRSFTTFMKVFSLPSAMTVSVGSDTTLMVESGGSAKRLIPIGPLLFKVTGSQELIGFREDSSGRITNVFSSDDPTSALDRQDALDAPSLHYTILGGGLLMFLLIAWGAFRRLFRIELEPDAPFVWGRRLMTIAAIASLVFIVLAMRLGQDFVALIFSDSAGQVRTALVFPMIGLAATIGAAVAVIAEWLRGRAAPLARLRLTGSVVVALLFFWSLSRWNLIGWHF